MNSFIAWLKSKSITSHSIAAAAIVIATIITTDEQARDLLLGLFQAHPKLGTTIVTVAGIILKYSHSSSDSGTLATAQEIKTKIS